ncbi:MAG: glycosyltransferase [Bacillota bacterium]
MRVAFFADSFREDLGGLTRAVIQMHDLLLRHGAAVRVYTLPQTGGPVHPGDVVSVPALPLNALPGMPPDSWLAVGHWQVLRSLRDWRPDVVHLHTPFPVSRLGLRAARTLGVPSVATYHADVDALGAYPGGKLARRLAWHLAAGLYNGCDLVLAPSAFSLQQLRRGGVTRPIVVLSNGVDLDRFAPGHFAPDLEDRRGLASAQGEPAVVATYVGRLSPEKGTRLLAETCRLALDEEQRLRVRLVGMGPDLARLRRRLGVLADRVEIGGAVAWERMPSVYAASDLLVFPSPSETQGLAVLEALASGLPVVAVDAGAVPEVVVHGQTGLLVPPGDAAAMAGALVRLARSPQERLSMGRRARQRAAEHDVQRSADRLLALYSELKAGRGISGIS